MSDTAEADLEAIAARLAAVEAEVADAALVRYTADAGATVLEPVAGAVDGIEPAAAWSISVEDAGAAEATSAGDAEASPPLPVSVAQSRVLEGLRSSGVAGAWFHRVASDYYDRPLASRAKLLRAPQAHLCKTLVLENTEWQAPGAARGGGAAATAAGAAGGADAEALYSRFYCVVVQYTSKLRPDVLAKQLRHREGRGRSIAAYKFQLAKEEDSDAMTGFTHNGVTPFALAQPGRLPVVVSAAIAKLDPPFVWLGGGEADLKLRVPTRQLIEATGALVLHCSVPRDEGDEEDELA